MMLNALMSNIEILETIAPKIHETLDALKASLNLAGCQAMALAAMVVERKPDIIIDLGTGSGASAASMAIAAGAVKPQTAIMTFDLSDHWTEDAVPRLVGIDRSRWAPVRTMLHDIATFDFASLIGENRSIVVFWDAHGYEVASGVLCHLMPHISDRRHIVICHDMSDNRMQLDANRSYGAKSFWRGANDWTGNTAYTNLGWLSTTVEQCIPILDFCYRNKTELGSVDYDVFIAGDAKRRTEMAERLGLAPLRTFDMAYFSLENTAFRNFPAG